MDSPSVVFHDFFPVMAHKLGSQGLIQELAKGFQLLADPSTQRITISSLQRAFDGLGLPAMDQAQLLDMISLGDTEGRGELDLHQFCVAMVRTCPELMEEAMNAMFDGEFLEDDFMGEDEYDCVATSSSESCHQRI